MNATMVFLSLLSSDPEEVAFAALDEGATVEDAAALAGLPIEVLLAYLQRTCERWVQ